MTEKTIISDPLIKKKSHSKKKKEDEKILILTEIKNPIWVSVSETAKLGGVNSRTIRRAIQNNNITYKIVKNRYQTDLKSALHYLHSNKKLRNKLYQNGIGQYIENWQK
ncbi:hypothetical protein KAU09_03545 [Candidatus Parcubacteria bacterium]|nr:hypothetical protein [Candidatus Parcubacteria bacterium]